MEVIEDERVEAEMQDAQQQRGLLPQEQLPPDAALSDDFSLRQSVRSSQHVVRNEAHGVRQRHGRHADRRPPGICPQQGVSAAAKEPPESQEAGEQHGERGVQEQRRAEDHGQRVPVEADALLQRRTAEETLLLNTQRSIS